MKTHLFNVFIAIALLIYIIYKSISGYDSVSFIGIMAFNLAWAICFLIGGINLVALVKWRKFDINYHTRMILIIGFITAICLNTILFENENENYLMIPLVLAALLAFHFRYKHKIKKT